MSNVDFQAARVQKAAMSSKRESSERIVTLSFPATRTALWDHRPTGPPSALQLSYFRPPKLVVHEKVLRLAHSYAEDSGRPGFPCLLVGNVSIDSDSEGITIRVERFDPGRLDDTGVVVPTTHVPGDVCIPCVLYQGNAKENICSAKDYEKSIKALHSHWSRRGKIDMAKSLVLVSQCGYKIDRNDLLFHFEIDMVTIGTGIKATPINPVSIVPTALSKNLAGPLNMSEVQGEPKSGYVTMDHTRKALMVLESDPKVDTLPIVGIWISGTSYVYDPFVWASCLRYLYNANIQERVCAPPEPFLLIMYSNLHSKPEFYECRTFDDSNHFNVELLSCSELVKMKKNSQESSKIPVEMEVRRVDEGYKKTLFDSALKNSRDLLSVVEKKQTYASGVDSTAEDIVPRASPSPHQIKASTIHSCVPDVSLFFEDGISLSHQRSDNESPIPHQILRKSSTFPTNLAHQYLPGQQDGHAKSKLKKKSSSKIQASSSQGHVRQGNEQSTTLPVSPSMQPFPEDQPRPRISMPNVRKSYEFMNGTQLSGNAAGDMQWRHPGAIPQTDNSYPHVNQRHGQATYPHVHNQGPLRGYTPEQYPGVSASTTYSAPSHIQPSHYYPRASFTAAPSRDYQQNYPAPQFQPLHYPGMRPHVNAAYPAPVNGPQPAPHMAAHPGQHPTTHPGQHPPTHPGQHPPTHPGRHPSAHPASHPLPSLPAHWTAGAQSHNHGPYQTRPTYNPNQMFYASNANPAQYPNVPVSGTAADGEVYIQYNQHLGMSGRPPPRPALSSDSVPHPGAQLAPSSGGTITPQHVLHPACSSTVSTGATNHLQPQQMLLAGNGAVTSVSTANQETARASQQGAAAVAYPQGIPPAISGQLQKSENVHKTLNVVAGLAECIAVPDDNSANRTAEGDDSAISMSGQDDTTGNQTTSSQNTGSPSVDAKNERRKKDMQEAARTVHLQSVPDDVYELLRQQDNQLKILQSHIQMLLAAQNSNKDKSDSVVEKQTEVTQSSGDNGFQPRREMCSVAINTSMMLEDNHPPQGQESGPVNEKYREDRYICEPQHEKASVREREIQSTNSSSSLTSVPLPNIHNHTMESMVSDIVVDIPSFQSSPHREHNVSELDSTRSPELGESASMYANDSLEQPQADIEDPLTNDMFEVRKQKYEHLIGNIKQLLARHSSPGITDQENQEVPEAKPSQPATKTKAPSAGGRKKENYRNNEDVATATKKRIKKLGIKVDTPKTSSKVDQSSFLCDPAFLPKVNYVSMLLEKSDSDLSSEVDALAMKYLTDEQLSELAKLRLSTPRKMDISSNSCLNSVRDGMSSSDTSTWGTMGNNMSFATKKYMQRYGLIEGAVSSSSDSDQDADEESSDTSKANMLEFVRKLAESSGHSSTGLSDNLDGSYLLNSSQGYVYPEQPQAAQYHHPHVRGKENLPETYQDLTRNKLQHTKQPSKKSQSPPRGVGSSQENIMLFDTAPGGRKHLVQEECEKEASISSNGQRVLDIERLRQLPKLL